MSKFKKKNSMIKESKTIFSLSEKHNEKLQEFEKINKTLPSLKKQIIELETQQQLESSLKNCMIIDHEINKIKSRIINIETDTDVNNYFLNNSSRLLKYFSDSHESKATILEDYMKTNKQKNYKGKILRNVVDDICTICNTEKSLDTTLSIMVCNTCANIDEVIINCDKPNFKDVPNDKSQYTYDRRHHFKELINQVQGKESTIIPDSVIEQVKKEIKKHRLLMIDIHKFEMRNILKKIRLTKYYEHIANILTKINPSAVIRFTKDEEDKLFYMFNCIQEPFIRFCPETRKNLINYNYIFYKFCQILKLNDSYKNYFTLLKSRTKLAQHDKIWKKIIIKIQESPVYQADDIDWKFYASI
jgi:hypothetical protein